MERYFEKYKRFLGAFFLLWLFLWTAGKFGFNFGIDLRFFFRVFFGLFLVFLVYETKIRWPVIYPIIKTLILKIRDKFTLKTEIIKKELISSSPKTFAGKTGNPLVLVLAVIISLFSFFRQFFKALSHLIFQPGILLVFVILGILSDIFIFNFTSSLIILFLVGFWVWIVYHFKFKGKVSIGLALGFLILCPFLLVYKKALIAEKTAIWVYVFLIIGVAQLFIEYLKEEKISVQKED